MTSPRRTNPTSQPADLNPRLVEIRARKAERRAIRAEFAARRRRGLEYRHAQRLRNLAVAHQRAAERAEPDSGGWLSSADNHPPPGTTG